MVPSANRGSRLGFETRRSVSHSTSLLYRMMCLLRHPGRMLRPISEGHHGWLNNRDARSGLISPIRVLLIVDKFYIMGHESALSTSLCDHLVKVSLTQGITEQPPTKLNTQLLRLVEHDEMSGFFDKDDFLRSHQCGQFLRAVYWNQIILLPPNDLNRSVSPHLRVPSHYLFSVFFMTLYNLSEKPCLALFPTLAFQPGLCNHILYLRHKRFVRRLLDIRA